MPFFTPVLYNNRLKRLFREGPPIKPQTEMLKSTIYCVVLLTCCWGQALSAFLKPLCPISRFLQGQSLDCLSGATPSNDCCDSKPIRSIPCFLESINKVFAHSCEWQEKEKCLLKILNRLELSQQEIEKHTFFDKDLAYTRNLVATDEKNYCLLMLCWGAGRESRIHNHPCNGCFVKVLSGAIQETRYSVDPNNDSMQLKGSSVCNAGSVTFMNDNIGLHKIGNPSDSVGAVSLHLYTPPFPSCKVRSSFVFS